MRDLILFTYSPESLSVERFCVWIWWIGVQRKRYRAEKEFNSLLAKHWGEPSILNPFTPLG